jgi:hypothetical protein
MSNIKAQKAGGAATAIKLKKESAEKYYKNPSICKQCGDVIQIKTIASQAKRKAFCSKSCSATYNNLHRKHNKKNVCPECGYEITKYATSCTKCCKRKEFTVHLVTKDTLKESRKNYQSARSTIRHHALHVWKNSGKKNLCFVCGYKNHIEICHIKPVSGFNGNATIEEINNIENLIALCPNHHWEFDNGILRLAELPSGTAQES